MGTFKKTLASDSLKRTMLVAAVLLTTGACNGNSFSGKSGANSPSPPPAPTPAPAPAPAAPGQLHAEFTFSGTSKSVKIAANFTPAGGAAVPSGDGSVSYSLVAGSVVSTPTGAFPTDLAQGLAASVMTATIAHASSTNNYTVSFSLPFKGLTNSGKSIADQTLNLSQAASSTSWTKSEGPQSGLGSVDSAATGSNSACTLASTGNQPAQGSYAIALTQAAPCDFQMPNVKVQGRNQLLGTTVSIGTYWIAQGDAAHKLPISSNTPTDALGNPILIDDGFFLVQPDGNTYLLVDAGNADSTRGGYMATQDIANQVSNSLGFGNTTLKQPNPGTAANNYTDATVFKKGSVIYIYDDTPDMAGQIDVSQLLSTITPTPMTLSWTASLAQH